MNVLIIVHVESEGPGTLGVFLVSAGATLRMARLYAGDSVPESIDGLDAVVSMGGPMNVYEEEKYPFLKHETTLLRKAIDAGRPVLGVCLGAQMIAKACGARVVKSPKKEVGWGQIFVTNAGKEDVLFNGLPPTLEVLQWHEDMFEIPEAGSLIATGNDCPNQAFRYRNAFGLQFHVEVTRDILADWFKDSPDLGIILRRHKELKPDLDRYAERMYRNFLSLIR
ncbi:MAG TPA: type 1 glutamine amidotransferase [Desulfomonilaceae bacterium]|nr:type 1 glutamine amidotransferase [Desulfomonilaceae bacterium]